MYILPTLNILFENENFFLLDKPAGQLSIPGRFDDLLTSESLLNLLTEKLKRKVFVVHRLDREVSGLILFAKNPHAHMTASQWFENRTVVKKYEALTELQTDAWPEPHSKYHWESFLLKGKKRAYEKPFGKKSVTEAEFIGGEKFKEATVGRWLLEPKTGRSHQLRFELFKHFFPILGDELYGAKTPFPSGIALRAISLDFSKCSQSSNLGLKPNYSVASNFQKMI